MSDGYKYNISKLRKGENMITTIGSRLKDDNGNEYELIGQIGQGGFGIVYKAKRISDGKIFAIKTLLSAFANEDIKKTFMNEIRVAQEIKGENVIEYIFAHDGEKFSELPPYIIMEYADNGTLQNLIDERIELNKPFELSELINYYKQLIKGMKIINQKIVHRDVKPANILICGEKIKISDFGLAKIAEETTRSKTFKGYGTYLYMAPETWNYEKNTIQMDIYSMGIVFYQLATLEYPYDYIESYEEIKNAHLCKPIKNIKRLQQMTNSSIASIISRMLSKPTKGRFKNWDEILELLDKNFDDDSILNSLVSKTIQHKNEIDIRTQQKLEEEHRKKEQEKNFITLVKSQFENEILNLIHEYIEQYNSSLASIDKAELLNEKNYGNNTNFKYTVNIPTLNYLDVELKIILPNSFSRTVQKRMYYDNESPTYTQYYTPEIKSKKVLGYVVIENKFGYGFNMLLCAGDGMYGDWVIAINKNNLSIMDNSKVKNEPFAYHITELEDLISNAQATGLYRSDIHTYTNNDFLNLMHSLINQ